MDKTLKQSKVELEGNELYLKCYHRACEYYRFNRIFPGLKHMNPKRRERLENKRALRYYREALNKLKQEVQDE